MDSMNSLGKQDQIVISGTDNPAQLLLVHHEITKDTRQQASVQW